MPADYTAAKKRSRSEGLMFIAGCLKRSCIPRIASRRGSMGRSTVAIDISAAIAWHGNCLYSSAGLNPTGDTEWGAVKFVVMNTISHLTLLWRDKATLSTASNVLFSFWRRAVTTAGVALLDTALK